MDNFDTIKPLPSTTLPSLHNKSVDLLTCELGSIGCYKIIINNDIIYIYT